MFNGRCDGAQVHGFIEASGDGKLWKLLVGGITNNIWQGPEYVARTATRVLKDVITQIE